MQVNSNFYVRSRQTHGKKLDYFDYFVSKSHTGHHRAESTSGHDCTLAGCFGPFQMLTSLITTISEYMCPEPQLIDENAGWSGGNSDHFKPDNASAITAKTWQKRAEKILHAQLQQMRKREQTTQKKDWKKHETAQRDSDQQLQQLADWFRWDTGHMWRHGNTAVSRGSLRQITQSSGVTKGAMYGRTLSGNIWYYLYDIICIICDIFSKQAFWRVPSMVCFQISIKSIGFEFKLIDSPSIVKMHAGFGPTLAQLVSRRYCLQGHPPDLEMPTSKCHVLMFKRNETHVKYVEIW